MRAGLVLGAWWNLIAFRQGSAEQCTALWTRQRLWKPAEKCQWRPTETDGAAPSQTTSEKGVKLAFLSQRSRSAPYLLDQVGDFRAIWCLDHRDELCVYAAVKPGAFADAVDAGVID